MFIALALSASILWTLVNYLDKYLIDWVTEDNEIGPLVMFSGLIGFPVVVLLIIWGLISSQNLLGGISLNQAVIIIASGFIYLLGIIPYLHALNSDEASVIVPQMLLTPVLGFFLAYALLGETLSTSEIIGSLYIVWGAISINFHKPKSIKSAAFVFGLMSLFSLAQAANSTLFKFIAVEDVQISTLFLYEYLGFILFFLLTFIFISGYRTSFINLLKRAGIKVFSINMLGETMTVGGNSFFHLATLFAPVALAHFVAEGTQPLIAIVLGIILTKSAKSVLEEDISLANVSRKILSIVVILVGMLIVIIKP